MLRVSEPIYKSRLRRMHMLTGLSNVPPMVIYLEARNLIRAWHPSLWYRAKYSVSSSLKACFEWAKWKLTGESGFYACLDCHCAYGSEVRPDCKCDCHGWRRLELDTPTT